MAMGEAHRKKHHEKKYDTPQPPVRLPSFADRPLAILLLLTIPATLIYSNTFSVPFHFDDVPYIINNHRIKDLRNLLDLSGTRYMGFLSFALNYTYGKFNVFGYHLVNLIIHITNALLVYWLVRLLFDTPSMAGIEPHPAGRSSGIALAVAILFVVHPIQTQAVTYIAQRFASLATLFYLLAVVCYLKWRLATPEKITRHFWYGLALLSTVLAMKTKEISFTLPLMLVLVEVVFFWSLARLPWRALIPFLLTLLIIPLDRVDALFGVDVGVARETTAISRLEYLFTQFRVIVTYLRLLMFPINQTLDYDYPTYHSLFELSVLVSFLVVGSLLSLALVLLIRAHRSPSHISFRLIGFGLLWFFLALSVESSIIPITDVIFEHRLYLPSVGIFLALSTLVFVNPPRHMLPWRTPAAAMWGWGAVMLVLAIATYERNFIWQDTLTLKQDGAKKAPKKARVHLGLGGAYQERGRLDKAIQEYQVALTLKPDYVEAYDGLGTIYIAQGHLDEAVHLFQRALQLDSHYSPSHYHLGNIYQAQGHWEAAVQAYRAAIQHYPGAVLAHRSLGDVYQAQKRFDEAIEAYQRALKLQPDSAMVYYSLGNTYATQSRWQPAIEAYRMALTLQPNLAKALSSLGKIYGILGRLDEAIQVYQRAITLQPDSAADHNDLGIMYAKQGRLSKAVGEFQAALDINPEDAAFHKNLGIALMQQGRREEAKAAFQRALQIEPRNEQARLALEALSQ